MGEVMLRPDLSIACVQRAVSLSVLLTASPALQDNLLAWGRLWHRLVVRSLARRGLGVMGALQGGQS